MGDWCEIHITLVYTGLLNIRANRMQKVHHSLAVPLIESMVRWHNKKVWAFAHGIDHRLTSHDTIDFGHISFSRFFLLYYGV